MYNPNIFEFFYVFKDMSFIKKSSSLFLEILNTIILVLEWLISKLQCLQYSFSFCAIPIFEVEKKTLSSQCINDIQLSILSFNSTGTLFSRSKVSAVQYHSENILNRVGMITQPYLTLIPYLYWRLNQPLF